MTTNAQFDAALALHRFGLGPVSGSIAAIADDPRGALLAELEQPGTGLAAAPNLPNSAAASRAFFEYRAKLQAQRKLAQRAKEAAAKVAAAKLASGGTAVGKTATPSAEAQSAEQDTMQDQEDRPANVGVQLVQDEAKVRIAAGVGAKIGFVERLVWFWSNHFCVSTDKSTSMSGAYEREAIRPHVLGRFADLLVAVESHPAMLYYLDNAELIGPNSVAGINRNRGINENFAREILELHTLGVRTGYTQADVTRFANTLTGWTFIGTCIPEHGGEFVFFERAHEPGEQTVLGKRYPDTGFAQGRAVLADLARHPATARHVAEKFARHFVGDEPPPELVNRLRTTFSDTDGDLKQLARTLILAEESWTPARKKLKRPCEWHIAALRLTGSHGRVASFMTGQTLLGEPLWRPPAPNGFSDYEAAWIDGLAERADIASNFAARVADRLDPKALVDEGLGPLASPQTREAVGRAGSRAQALALLLMSPEFLRR